MKQVEKNVAKIDGIVLFGGRARDALLEIAARMARGEQTAVCTPNPIMLENAMRDKELRAALLHADLNLPDGIGVLLAARLLGERMVERVSGVDMAARVVALAARRGERIYLLGGEKGVAEEAAKRLVARLPGLFVCGVCDGYFSVSEEREVLLKIRAARPDILLVCLGSPKQEIFIDRYREWLPDVRLFMALGGTLDVWAGKTRRAPCFVQNVGLEWLWRMLNEPRRLRDLPKMAAFSCRMLKNFCQSAQSGQINGAFLKKI